MWCDKNKQGEQTLTKRSKLNCLSSDFKSSFVALLLTLPVGSAAGRCRQMRCKRCFKLAEPLTWHSFKREACSGYIAFSCRTLGNQSKGEGSREQQEGVTVIPPLSGHDLSLCNSTCAMFTVCRDPLGTAPLLQRLFSPGLRSPQDADFSHS